MDRSDVRFPWAGNLCAVAPLLCLGAEKGLVPGIQPAAGQATGCLGSTRWGIGRATRTCSQPWPKTHLSATGDFDPAAPASDPGRSLGTTGYCTRAALYNSGPRGGPAISVARPGLRQARLARVQCPAPNLSCRRAPALLHDKARGRGAGSRRQARSCAAHLVVDALMCLFLPSHL